MGKGPACPHCQSRESSVVDKRPGKRGVRRRRQCGDCNKRFTTLEMALDLDEKVPRELFTRLEWAQHIIAEASFEVVKSLNHATAALKDEGK